MIALDLAGVRGLGRGGLFLRQGGAQPGAGGHGVRRSWPAAASASRCPGMRPEDAPERFLGAWAAMRARLVETGRLKGQQNDDAPEPPDLPRQPRHHAGRPARAGRHAALVEGGKFANPHSVEHAMGRAAEEAVEAARAEIAELIGAEAREVVLTSGATESNNLAIKGAARFAAGQGQRAPADRHARHRAQMRAGKRPRPGGRGLRAGGPAGRAGRAGRPRPAAGGGRRPHLLVSVMAVNNEIGVIQDSAAIGAIAAEGALLPHRCGAGRRPVPLDVEEIQRRPAVDLRPQDLRAEGIGALYVRRRPRVRLVPLFSGGGQERGFRSGTLPAPLWSGWARRRGSRR